MKKFQKRLLTLIALVLGFGCLLFGQIQTNKTTVMADASTDTGGLSGYEVYNMYVSDNNLHLYGWFLMRDITNYRSGKQTYTLKIGDRTYTSSGAEYVDMTEMYKLAQVSGKPCSDSTGAGQSNKCYYSYQDVGFHFTIPLSDLDTYGVGDGYPRLSVKDRVGNTYTTRIKFVSGLSSVSTAGYNYSFSTRVDTSSLTVDEEQVIVRKTAGKTGSNGYLDSASGKYYNWKYGAKFSNIYDVSMNTSNSKINWYKLRFKIVKQNTSYGSNWPLAVEGTTNYGWISGNFSKLNGDWFKITRTPKSFYLDLNGMLDGATSGGIAGYGTADVYINGSLVANDVTDFYQQYPYGTRYEIKDIRAATGRTYNGVYSGSTSGTIGTGNVAVSLNFTINSYTNTVSHWAWGFNHGEGNNGDKRAFALGNTTFVAKYGSTYTMNSSKQTAIPNGFYLGGSFGTSNISGSWNTYPMGTNVTQQAYGMSYEYDYYPTTYSIGYNMNGGTNNPSNPGSYNVLYGVTFNNPTRDRYTFMGWYEGNNRIYGINQGKGASFSSASDMYNQLAGRTTGNKTITAKWDAFPTLSLKDFKVIEGDDFPVSNLITGKGYITQGTAEFPEKLTEVTYTVTADDAEDGAASVTNKIKVESVIGPNGEKLSNVDTSKPGNYKVTYSVTDSVGGRTEASRTITVLPSSTAEIQADDRYFYRGSDITSDILKSKIIAKDKYDGIITGIVEIPDLENINNQVAGEYEITYRVTNRSHKTTTKKIKVYIIDTITDLSTPYDIRFIEGDLMGTLGEESKWKTNSQLNLFLLSSMQKNTKDEAVAVYEFSNKDIEDIKEKMKNEGFSQKGK